MTTRDLNASERASFLIGEAVRKVMDFAPQDPEADRERRAVMAWLEYAMTPEEFATVANATGWHSFEEHGPEFLPGRRAPRPRSNQPDGIPF